MGVHRLRRKWPEGTYMRLISGDRLRRAIERKGLSYREMAEDAGCSKSMIGHLCTERRRTCPPALAERIARRVDYDLDALFVPRLPLDGGQNVNQRKKLAA